MEERQEGAEGRVDAVGSSRAERLSLGMGRGWLSTDLMLLLCLG